MINQPNDAINSQNNDVNEPNNAINYALDPDEVTIVQSRHGHMIRVNHSTILVKQLLVLFCDSSKSLQ